MKVWSLATANEQSSLIWEGRQRGGVLLSGKLTISEEQLAKFTHETFWELVKEFKVNELAIQTTHDIKSYKVRVLEQLIKKNIRLSDLVKEMTLEFAAGEQLQITRATLRLCGDFFEALFSSGMREIQSDKIILNEVSLHGFWKILTAVESGELKGIAEAAHELEFLQFYVPLLEGFLGQKEWSKWGNVGPVPFPPQWLLDAYDKDKHIAFYMPAKIDGQWLTINSFGKIGQARHQIGYRHICDKVAADIGDIHGPDEGYWCLRLKVLHPDTKNKSFNEQKDWISVIHPGYEVLLAREAIISELLYYVASDKTNGFLGTGSVTRCKDVVRGQGVKVGGLDPSGLVVTVSDDDRCIYTGLLPVRIRK